MKIRDYFDRVYVINLPHRTDRRRGITRELAACGLGLEQGKVEIFPGVLPAEAAGFPSIAVRGCLLSHFEILKLACSQGLRNVLIIEDDLGISPQLRREEDGIVEQLRATDWGIVYLGHFEKVEPAVPARLIPYPTDKHIITTHFYGVSGLVAERLVRFLEALQQRPAGHPLGGPMYPDGAISTFRQQNPDVVTLVACPSLGWQRSSPSDLHPAWFDRLPGVRALVQLGRAGRNWLRRCR